MTTIELMVISYRVISKYAHSIPTGCRFESFDEIGLNEWLSSTDLIAIKCARYRQTPRV